MKKIIYYKILKFRKEIISAVITTFTVVLGYSLSVHFNSPIVAAVATIVAGILGLSITIYYLTLEKDLYFIPLSHRNNKKDWTGEGYFDLAETQNSYEITKSYWGFIFQKTLNWGNYSLNFDFKILNSCLGVIIRAVNHSNFILLQINPDGVKPHVFVNGGYKVFDFDETNLKFQDQLSFDCWHKCSIQCVGQEIFVKVSNKDNSFDRSWNIPEGVIFFKYYKDEGDKNPVKIPFPITLEYGTFGFRNHDREKALIKNVLVTKL